MKKIPQKFQTTDENLELAERIFSQIKIAHIRPQPRKNCYIISECTMLLSRLLKIKGHPE